MSVEVHTVLDSGERPARAPTGLYRAESVRALDRIAIDEIGVPGAELMERAGAATWRALLRRWPRVRGVAVACGVGNNAGDGYVVARLARENGVAVRALAVAPESEARGDAALALARMREAGIDLEAFTSDALGECEVVVDALFGTGLARALEGPWAAAVDALNRCGRPVVAIDIPSGLAADTGTVLGAAVRAVCTVTFIARKPGLYTAHGPERAGEIVFAGLGVEDEVAARRGPDLLLARLADFESLLAPRPRNAHKGRYGHVVVVGGDHGYAGAARLAAEAAGRGGAGLVSVATRAEHLGVITGSRPELMCHAVADADALAPLLERATVLAVGPGLGRGDWGRKLCEHALASDLPAVVDADAINLIAAGEVAPRRGPPTVYTPHPGEAARVLGCTVAEVEADRPAAASALVAAHPGIWVLKGAGSVVAAPGELARICAHGNPGMASGGMGDTLTGIIAALLAQHVVPPLAAALGVCAHGHAADLAAASGERGLLAGDLLAELRALLNP